MSLFNWFSRKPAHANYPGDSDGSAPGTSFRSQPMRDKISPAAMPRPAADAVNRSEERKVKRHARREQLYIAVREAMTYAGVLSASYKFKVLSLDQRGDQFMVMMDIDQTVDAHAANLNTIEQKVIHAAKARFEIVVSAVYWRINTSGTSLHHRTAAVFTDEHQSSAPASLMPEPVAASLAPVAAATPVARKPGSRYEPIQDDEVAAFKQALAVASANNPQPAPANGKSSRSGPRSYTLLTGFEDTEMPDSYTAPVLSNTQYGDLN